MLTENRSLFDFSKKLTIDLMLKNGNSENIYD